MTNHNHVPARRGRIPSHTPEALALLTILRLAIGQPVTSDELKATAEVLCKSWDKSNEEVVHYLEELVRAGRVVTP